MSIYLLLMLNPFLQILQTNGFSAVCIRKCSIEWSFTTVTGEVVHFSAILQMFVKNAITIKQFST
jgi:hypothetical protein